MSDVQGGFGGKLENLFLSILRVVILVVLAVSLMGSLVLGLWGIKDLNTTATPYKAEPVDNKALIQQLKKLFETSPADSQPSPRKPRSPDSLKDENKILEDEFEKQARILFNFAEITSFDKLTELSFVSTFKQKFREEANSLALDPKSEASVLAYAKGQTELLTMVFSDEEFLIEIAKKGAFKEYFEHALEIYPAFFREGLHNPVFGALQG
jgi:hypothetical protein